MDMIKLYIERVKKRLPESQRQDIALELESSILDSLPDFYTEDDIKRELEKLGDPDLLAYNYRDKPRQLISPSLYPFYKKMLLIAFLMVATISIFFFITQQFLSGFLVDFNLLENGAIFLGQLLWILFNVAVQVFFWVTIILTIVDRVSGNLLDNEFQKKWSVEQLVDTPFIPKEKRISQGEVITRILWTIFLVTIFLYIANWSPIFQDSSSLFNVPLVRSFGPALMGVVFIQVGQSIYMSFAKRWTYKLAVGNTVTTIAGFSLLTTMFLQKSLLHNGVVISVADLLNQSVASVSIAVNLVKWLIIIAVAVTGVISIYQGFKKSRISS